MKLDIKKIFSFFLVLFCLFTLSCVSIKKAVIEDDKLFLIPHSKQHSAVGSMKISKLYFDPISLDSSFKSASDQILNNIVPDVLYDLNGDICWISNFDVIHNSIKCFGLCTEIRFDIIALKQK